MSKTTVASRFHLSLNVVGAAQYRELRREANERKQRGKMKQRRHITFVLFLLLTDFRSKLLQPLLLNLAEAVFVSFAHLLKLHEILLFFVKDVVTDDESENFTSDLNSPDKLLRPSTTELRRTFALLAEAKGVAGLGKAGGDSQGGSDKAGQQVPPEVYNALTYAGTAFLFTLSVPLILYGLNKLLNKIEDCFGCGPSSKKSKQKQTVTKQKQSNKTKNQQQIYSVTSSKPHLMYEQMSRQYQKNSSSRIVSMSSDEDDQLSCSDNKHSQQKLHEQYSNHQSQLFNAAINGSIDIASSANVNNNSSNHLTHSITATTTPTTAITATAAATTTKTGPISQQMHQQQTQHANSCAITLPFDTNPFAMDPLNRAMESNNNSNNNDDSNNNSNNDFNNVTTLAHKPPIGTQIDIQHPNRNQQLQHDGNNITKLYQGVSVNINNGLKSQPYIMSSSSPMRM